MLGITNQDSSFFDIKIGGSVDSKIQEINDRIVSFEVKEEMHRIISGSITLDDPYYMSIDRFLRPGQKLEIRWGYKRPDASLLNILQAKDNPEEITGLFERSGVKAFILNPSGGGDSDGRISYSCSFMGTEVMSGNKWKIYSDRPMGVIVGEVMSKMNIYNQLINFKRQNYTPTSDTALIQDRSNFKFLNELAFREDAIFAVGYGAQGAVGLFANYNTRECEMFNNMVTQSSGNTISLSFKEGAPNVINYTFQQNTGDAAGDNAQIMAVGGQVTIRRFKAESQTVESYQLNPEKSKAEIKSKKGFSAQIKYAADLMKIDNFDELVHKEYFIKTIQQTAPQGYGWTFNVEALGNPLWTSPSRVKFLRGFPSIVIDQPATKATGGLNLGKVTRFWTRSVTHKISREGYRCSLDVADALTITGGSFVG